jgi:lysophospholipase L1-like esterase
MQSHPHWVGTWTAAPADAERVALANQTIRLHPRISLGGQMLRVRLSNAFGKHPVIVGAARIALRAGGPAIVPKTGRLLTFAGEPSAVIAAGAPLISDPVHLEVPALADLSVSIYLPGDQPASLPVTGRYARQTNYLSPPGDFTADEVMQVGRLADDWYFLCGVDVVAPPDSAGIIAFGDSLTDANISTLDAFCRWPDELSRRLQTRDGGRRCAVMNQGLGGNRILHDLRADSGLRRFDRDVLAQPGVTHVIVMLGTNDLRNRWGKPEEEVTTSAMIAGLKQMIERAHLAGLQIFGCTLTPFENETFYPGAWTPAREARRQDVNRWIREAGAFDTVIDFDAALRDPEHPARLLPAYDCGDHLHPSDRGYVRMGEVIELELFES